MDANPRLATIVMKAKYSSSVSSENMPKNLRPRKTISQKKQARENFSLRKSLTYITRQQKPLSKKPITKENLPLGKKKSKEACH